MDACTRKGQGGKIYPKGSKDTMLISYSWMDLRDDLWGGGVYICNFGIYERYKQWQPDNLREGLQRAYHATKKEWGYSSFGVKLSANFTISAYKIKIFISYELKGLFI